MDRTLINLASIFVGGAGLFTVLTGFNVLELNMSFFDANPYAIKRDVIENTMKWLFTFVAFIGLMLQWWRKLPRQGDTSKGELLVSSWARYMAGGRPANASWGRSSL